MIRLDAVAQSVISGCATVTFGAVVGRFLARRPLERHEENQRQIAAKQDEIADRLDPTTPGGIADLLPTDPRKDTP